MTTDDLEAAKRAAGTAAAQLVESGMHVGLGTGSTAAWFVRALGERVRAGLRVTGVATSLAVEQLAHAEGIVVEPLDARDLDLAVDGADAITARRDALKGYGGALFREKMVALAARRFVIVIDETKRVETLCDSKRLPIEVMQFGVERTLRAIERVGLAPKLRTGETGLPVISDNGQYLVDAELRMSIDPQRLAHALDAITGVVEHGLFLGLAHRVIVGRRDGSVFEFGVE